MEPLQFLSALAAIVVIDLVLAGDNAIVIASATRRLPEAMRKRAIIWGTVGAVVVRSLMTMGVVWLLQIPGLMAVGGVMLVWIAYKLLADKSDEEDGPQAADGFFAAIKTIVIADLVMGLDNVLGVAGAAQGSFALVVAGLLISIPIVVWGSQLILRLIDRFQWIIYVGAGVLAWTAATMIVNEPLSAPVLAEMPWLKWLSYVVIMGAVLGGGWLANRDASAARPEVAPQVIEFNPETQTADAAPAAPAASAAPEPLVATVAAVAQPVAVPASPAAASPASTFLPVPSEETVMTRILIPVDGSSNAMLAVRHAVKEALDKPGLEVHLLHVRIPLPRHIARFLKHGERGSWNRSEAEAALAPARELLDRHGVAHAEHVLRGAEAHSIDRLARRIKADQILIGASRLPLVARMFRRSLATSLMEVSSVPVQVIGGDRPSLLARYGLPAGAGAILLAVLAEALD